MALKSPGVSSLVDRHRKYFDLDRRGGKFDKLDISLNTSSEQCVWGGKIYFQQVQEKNYLVTSCMAFAK